MAWNNKRLNTGLTMPTEPLPVVPPKSKCASEIDGDQSEHCELDFPLAAPANGFFIKAHEKDS